MDADYLSLLSRQSMQLQGGLTSVLEVAQLEQEPFFRQADRTAAI